MFNIVSLGLFLSVSHFLFCVVAVRMAEKILSMVLQKYFDRQSQIEFPKLLVYFLSLVFTLVIVFGVYPEVYGGGFTRIPFRNQGDWSLHERFVCSRYYLSGYIEESNDCLSEEDKFSLRMKAISHPQDNAITLSTLSMEGDFKATVMLDWQMQQDHLPKGDIQRFGLAVRKPSEDDRFSWIMVSKVLYDEGQGIFSGSFRQDNPKASYALPNTPLLSVQSDRVYLQIEKNGNKITTRYRFHVTAAWIESHGEIYWDGDESELLLFGYSFSDQSASAQFHNLRIKEIY